MRFPLPQVQASLRHHDIERAPRGTSTRASSRWTVLTWCLLGCAVLLGQPALAQQFPLGTYVGSPNGNDATAEAQFEANYNAFVQSMGRPARTMDVFIDYTQPISQWVANASWYAWSQSLSPEKNLIPVVSVGLIDNATAYSGGSWNETARLAMFNAVAAGDYDDVFQGIVSAYGSNGFPNIYLRIGWEQNGTWEPWYATGSATEATAYVAAWQHVATIARAVSGVTVKTVWCPNIMAWSAVDVSTTYPGDDSGDVIAPDLYSPVYPGQLWDWSTNSLDTDATAWAANPVNREHFWDYPGATEWNTTAGWGMISAIAFAKTHNKPFGLSETGAGNNGTTTGPVDEGDFPTYLTNRLSSAVSQGVPLEFVNVWDIDVGDGSWDFSDGTKPNEAAAWLGFSNAGSSAGISSTAWYQVVNTNSNLCVETSNWGTANGTVVDQYTCGNAQYNQAWQFQPTDSGFYQVISRNATNQVWDVQGGVSATADGTPIQTWQPYQDTNQQWQPVSLGNGTYKFVVRNSGKCLDVPGLSTSTGVQLDIWTCNGGANQSFTLQQVQ